MIRDATIFVTQADLQKLDHTKLLFVSSYYVYTTPNLLVYHLNAE